MLKDLAGVVKTLNDQGTELEGTECGVVLLPPCLLYTSRCV